MSTTPDPGRPYAVKLVGGRGALAPGEPTPPADAPIHLMLSNVGAEADNYQLIVAGGPQAAIEPQTMRLKPGEVRPLRLANPPGMNPTWAIQVRSRGADTIVATWTAGSP